MNLVTRASILGWILGLLGCGGGSAPSSTGATSAEVPVAQFTVAPATGPAPLSVAFADTSTGTITSRSWTFGDGGTSTEPHPVHRYEAAGTYGVTLTVTGPGGSATTSRPAAVVVLEAPPQASFNLTPASGRAPLAVTFTSTATGLITNQTWDFGDGATSTETHPTHTFTNPGSYTVSLTVNGPGGSNTVTKAKAVVVDPTSPTTTAWRFAVVGDTHTPTASLLQELTPVLLAEGVEVVLVPGDVVEAGAAASAATLASQLATWKQLVDPLRRAGIGVYPIRGNHEADARSSAETWIAAFADWKLPSNGPVGEQGLTYSVTHKNARFIGLDQYVSLHRVHQTWLDAQLTPDAEHPHIFVFGHEPAFKVFHTDCLDDAATDRDRFWKSLAAAGARVYFCGHDHFLDAARIDDGDGNATNDLLQVVVGTGGGALFDKYSYGGANSSYTPINVGHSMAHGYLRVDVSGTGPTDLRVTYTFMQRTVGSSGTPTYLPTLTFQTPQSQPRNYPIVDTGQTACYDARAEIPPPQPGAAFYGQDGQHTGNQPSYLDGGDGTVTDRVTGLMWVKARGSKLSWNQAVAGASTCRVGGYTDWRMPTIKELYSLILFTGAQGTSFTSTAGYIPFIDTKAFEFVYGAGTSSERVIDCQDWSGTAYVGTIMTGTSGAFGVNFADGRIKGYPMANSNYVRYVRSNPDYGRNAFQDNGDGTITDQATGLMWCQADAGVGMDWQTALAWVQEQNAKKALGHDDWRLPNAKELHSILDYSRAIQATDPTKRGFALDPIFKATPITDEGGSTDLPFYWTSTSFKDGTPNGIPAAYIAFGRALGYMQVQGSSTYQLLDVHGTGAQRSDPKSGNPTDYPLGKDAKGQTVYGRGPQGDVVRIRNGVRLVRDAR